MSEARLRVGIIGCGDVAHRHYLPALASLSGRVELVGCCDARLEAAERAAASEREWSPGVRAFDRLADMLAQTEPKAVFNLTPAPLHAAVTTECLEAGVHVYSEKPIAASVAEADALIEKAQTRGLVLLCAPASAATRRFRWLGDILGSGGLGRPTLVVGQCANMGPAGWREYTGDPSIFYGPGVGPVFDLGIYRLHEMTTLLGPVRRVGAMGRIAIPKRTVAAGPLAGRTISVTAPDHVLMNLEFDSGALGQLLASFAVPATQAPWLELYLTGGTISLVGDPFGSVSPASVFIRSESLPEAASGSAGRARSQRRGDGWQHGVMPSPPTDSLPIIGRGVVHFVAVVAGDEKPILTAEHARHVLEIVLAAYESIADGRNHDLTTTF
jgi:predicted dehydrogenase